MFIYKLSAVPVSSYMHVDCIVPRREHEYQGREAGATSLGLTHCQIDSVFANPELHTLQTDVVVKF